MPDELKKSVDDLMGAFEEFKSSNDERLKEIEKKGTADPLLVSKVDKINESLNQFEDLNQKLTLADQQNKAMQEQLDSVETELKRIGLGGTGNGVIDEEAKKYEKAFNEYLRKTGDDVSVEGRKALIEKKALVASNDALGGYYLAPPEMQSSIIKDLVELSPIRSLATVTPVGSKSLLLPKRTATFTAVRVAETGTRSETTGYGTGMVEIFAPDMYAEVHISEQMLEDSAYNLEAEMQMEFEEQFAVLEGTESVNGIGGGGEMEGILVNSDVGETVSGDADEITADGILGVFYDIKSIYASRGSYILNRASIKKVRLLKDQNDQYLWMPGLAQGQPNTINGAPYVEFPSMPNEAADAYPVAFGDFRRAYRVVDRVLLSVLRDPYTQSGSGKIRYLARKRTGGGVVLPSAIRKLKCSV
jgi:HK97 family phage major capsid protein